jgi:AcrR family transcriptional regulator
VTRASGVRELRRGQIVAAARGLVAEGGLDALTFAALEQVLGFTRGVITWHFRDKDEVVRAVFDDAVAAIDRTVLAAVRAEATPTDRVRAVVREMVRGWLGATDAGAVLVAYWGRLGSDLDLARLNAALYGRYREATAELVRSGQARGAFDPHVDADTVAALLVSLVIGVGLQASFERAAGSDRFALERAVDEAGEWVVRALSARGADEDRQGARRDAPRADL